MAKSHDCVTIKTRNVTNENFSGFASVVEASGNYRLRKPKRYQISYPAEYTGNDGTSAPLDALMERFKDRGYEVIFETAPAGPYSRAVIKVEKKE